MARIWTSRNTCDYVPSYIYLKIRIDEPVPEPQFDKANQVAVDICANYAVNVGGVVGKQYRVSEDMVCEDNPTVIIDGLMYVTYTGVIDVMCLVEDENIDEFIWDIEAVYKEVGGRIISEERACS